MKGLKPTLLTLVLPKKRQTLEEMRQAMVHAEHTTNASASRSVNSAAVCFRTTFWRNL